MMHHVKGPYVSNLKTFTKKPTNQGCALHVPASLGIDNPKYDCDVDSKSDNGALSEDYINRTEKIILDKHTDVSWIKGEQG